MRIIAGRAKGRTLAVPSSGTRPMTGRVRESIFSTLLMRIRDACILDLYAGSGSLGLEALSRGACTATFVERDRSAVRIIEENIALVGLGGEVVRGAVTGVIDRLPGPYDVVFVDPPYVEQDESVDAVIAALDPILGAAGVVIVHRQSASRLSTPEFLTSIRERHYGDAVVTMMERATS